jgi:hypothetical protein
MDKNVYEIDQSSQSYKAFLVKIYLLLQSYIFSIQCNIYCLQYKKCV